MNNDNFFVTRTIDYSVIQKILITIILILFIAGCSGNRAATLKSLSSRDINIEKEKIDNVSEAQVMGSYHEYLGDAPASHPMYANALNRLADLEMKAGDDKLLSDKDEIFQQALQVATTNANEDGQHNYENAIELYTGLLIANPDSTRNDWVLYQLASAYEKLGNFEDALSTLGRLIKGYPSSDYYIEAQFRSGDIYFLLQDYFQSEQAFKSVFIVGKNSAYYERAIYKYAWSLFKQEHYEAALDTFFISLSTLPIVYDLQEKIDTRALSKVEKDMLDDIFRAVNLCISYGGGVKYAIEYFDKSSAKPYEYEVFKRLGGYFIEHDRIRDAAEIYGVFVERQPNHPMASSLQVRRIKAYDEGRFGRAALSAREEFVNKFGVDTEFWGAKNTSERARLRVQAKSILSDLSEFYHARLQRDRKNKKYYNKAVYWYKQYIKTFPGDTIAANKLFLLGELYSEKKQYLSSAEAYYNSAYDYPAHKYSRKAAYGAVETYNKVLKSKALKNKDRTNINQRFVDSSIKFITDYPKDKKQQAVRMHLVEVLFNLNQFEDTMKYAEPFLSPENFVASNKVKNAKKLVGYQMSANVIAGHISFEQGDYLRAQSHYKKSILLGIQNKKMKRVVIKRLAASIYQYAEVMEREGNYLEAANNFLLVRSVVPKSGFSAQAQYDAAVAYIKLQNWKKAIKVLEQFRSDFPKHKLAAGVTDKLAVCYEKNNQYSSAAREILAIGKRGDKTVYRDATLEAAVLFEKDNSWKSAINTYKHYIRNFKLPLEESLEAKQKLVDLYLVTKKRSKRRFWIKKISATKNKNTLSDRSKYIVASATLFLANEKMRSYERVKLKLPLNRTLRKKKKLMKSTLLAYERLSDFGVEEFTTAATYKIAGVYQHLGVAIMTSQRPKRLTSEELEEYDLLLEEQAYPFEEKAIKIYELNLHRMTNGIYDNWVQKSILRLGDIQPARYAKQEVLNEMYTAID